MLDWGSLHTGVGSCRKTTRGNPPMEAGNSWAIRTTRPGGKMGRCLLRSRRGSLEKGTHRNSAILCRETPAQGAPFWRDWREYTPPISCHFSPLAEPTGSQRTREPIFQIGSSSWDVWEVDTGGNGSEDKWHAALLHFKFIPLLSGPVV